MKSSMSDADRLLQVEAAKQVPGLDYPPIEAFIYNRLEQLLKQFSKTGKLRLEQGSVDLMRLAYEAGITEVEHRQRLDDCWPASLVAILADWDDATYPQEVVPLMTLAYEYGLKDRHLKIADLVAAEVGLRGGIFYRGGTMTVVQVTRICNLLMGTCNSLSEVAAWVLGTGEVDPAQLPDWARQMIADRVQQCHECGCWHEPDALDAEHLCRECRQ
jgi:hypothetical protein